MVIPTTPMAWAGGGFLAGLFTGNPRFVSELIHIVISLST